MPIPVEDLEKRSEAFLEKFSKLTMPEKIRTILELFRYGGKPSGEQQIGHQTEKGQTKKIFFQPPDHNHLL